MNNTNEPTLPDTPSPSLGKGLKGGAFIIIVAGGSSKRMNHVIPKQFIPLQGKPVLMRTIEKFVSSLPDIQIIVVLASHLKQEWATLCTTHHFTVPHQVAEGGETRFHSVINGLTLVPNNCIVGVHDAARPLVSKQTILHAYEVAEEKGNAIPAVTIHESIREINGINNKAVNRHNYFMIQTPQCFHSNVLKKAFLQEYNPLFTDDASVLEAMGEKINLVEGNYENIKITTPQDLIIAAALLEYPL